MTIAASINKNGVGPIVSASIREPVDQAYLGQWINLSDVKPAMELILADPKDEYKYWKTGWFAPTSEL
jgi:hypothetical protein